MAKTNQAAFSAAGLSLENDRLKQEIETLKSRLDQVGKTGTSSALATENARLKQELDTLKRSVSGTEAENSPRELARLKELSGRSEQLLSENDKLKKRFWS